MWCLWNLLTEGKRASALEFLHTSRCLHQAIGHSSNAPSPNLKKLTMPASTAATMTVFLPWRSAMKGLGLSGAGSGGDCVERNRMYDSKLVRKDLGTASVGGGGLDTEEDVAGGALRLRGRGGGMVGKPLYMCVSSASVGIGVARALTTTIEKSGWGGAVLR